MYIREWNKVLGKSAMKREVIFQEAVPLNLILNLGLIHRLWNQINRRPTPETLRSYNSSFGDDYFSFAFKGTKIRIDIITKPAKTWK